jgi:hypothetical protein
MNRETVKTLMSEIRADLEAIVQILRLIDETRHAMVADQSPSLQEKAVSIIYDTICIPPSRTFSRILPEHLRTRLMMAKAGMHNC